MNVTYMRSQITIDRIHRTDVWCAWDTVKQQYMLWPHVKSIAERGTC